MKLSDFEMLPKGDTGLLGNQAVLQFGDYQLSIIDDGYGKEQGLYEIAVILNGHQIEMPGITNESDTVKGYLTEKEVNAIITKIYTLTRIEPTQV